MGPALDRRGFLQVAAGAGLSWLTPVGRLLADQAERIATAGAIDHPALAGGWAEPARDLRPAPRYPDRRRDQGDRRPRSVASSLPRGSSNWPSQMGSVALIRSMVSKEGDHERGTYLMKTGYRPDPTVVHPSIGAICCHELPVARTDIPRHISILTGQWPSKGGFLGGEFDAFQIDDPKSETARRDSAGRRPAQCARVQDLDVVERAFAHGRRGRFETTLHRETLARARTMMTSEQLKAFDVSNEPEALRAEYGDTPFGRGCLAARRLIEVGVRCVEVALDGWDSHVNNHEIHRKRVQGTGPGVRRAVARPDSEAVARSDCRRVLRRVRPDAQGQPRGRSRPLANRLQPGDWPAAVSTAV